MTNSTQLDFGDFITIDTNGFLKKIAAGEKIMGTFAEQSKTATSDNQTVAQYKGKYEPIDLYDVFEMTSDQACTQTDVGAYADVVIASAAINCDLAAGATGQLLVIDFDPDRNGSTTKVRVKVAEPQNLAFAQS